MRDRFGKPFWFFAGAFFGLLLGLAISGGQNAPREAAQNFAPSIGNADPLVQVEPQSGTSSSGASPPDGLNLKPAEIENWRNDPSSKGFNEEDRAFLKEHGVSETEARAAEEVLRREGAN